MPIVRAMTGFDITPYTPRDHAWLVHQHQTLYARNDGFDETFGPLVSDILTAFEAQHDPACEAGWILRDGAQPLGSIFCVRSDAETAKLRLFLLMPELRGQGQGARLLRHCMTFAAEAGYSKMTLWTHESHRAACALYRRFGWTCSASKPVHSFGVDLVEQQWDIRLDAHLSDLQSR